ncbi:MAG: glutamyl-tRNA reductase [Elusimicrobia bacterium]|nr:glutamyl-tRNA reductase [Elusimicrobiota bacterium]
MGPESERLVVVGINHLGAPVACRERAAVPAAKLAETLSQLRSSLRLAECAVVSTCSRVEVVAVLPTGEGPEGLAAWFHARVGAEGAASVYVKRGPEAVRHLFRVAGGLDSWIIGESEILAQLKNAYAAARDGRHTGRHLNRVFQSALAAGKSVRARTGIQNGIHSIGGAAALVAKGIFREAGGEVVVFGAGQAAEAVVRHLAAKNFSRISVANRTLERAAAVAGPLGAEALDLEQGLDRLATAEVAVFSLSTEEPWLGSELLWPLVRGRDRALFIVDLGLPRNVDERCADLEGVYLYDLDALKEMVRESMDGKAAAKDLAEVLILDEAVKCWKELSKAPCAPRLCVSSVEGGAI